MQEKPAPGARRRRGAGTPAYREHSQGYGSVGYLTGIACFGWQDCATGTDDALVAVLADKFAEYRPHTDERGWRLYLGSEARAQAALRECGLAAAAA